MILTFWGKMGAWAQFVVDKPDLLNCCEMWQLTGTRQNRRFQYNEWELYPFVCSLLVGVWWSLHLTTVNYQSMCSFLVTISLLIYLLLKSYSCSFSILLYCCFWLPHICINLQQREFFTEIVIEMLMYPHPVFRSVLLNVSTFQRDFPGPFWNFLSTKPLQNACFLLLPKDDSSAMSLSMLSWGCFHTGETALQYSILTILL